MCHPECTGTHEGRMALFTLHSSLHELQPREGELAEHAVFEHCPLPGAAIRKSGQPRLNSSPKVICSFPASSAHILRSSGILSVSQQAWTKVSRYSLEGYSWLERNVPVYYSQVLTVLGPNLKLVWTKTNETAVYVSGKCSSQISWVKDNLPWFTEWLQARVPDFLLHFAECIKELLLLVLQRCVLPALESVGTALERGWELCVDACNGEVSWDCMRKHLTSFTYSSWMYLQNTTLAIKNWALAMISGH
ncbi:transmembrane protein 214-A-like [Malaclemys terrapin pileata]|uniref:transmembrane protein 214-A-like n=1 Tax=Malaclemys terrapin pileata TaxID=2991368 RepID=UPI0023A8A1BD|nr:transmembrane protein 214-A-like [Malaclemys terrapin pileata]